ncbi:hypothetical protein [Prochlorococcus marinus]|uniref:Uncharacterized protein n=1 Tax=Prochlorococcus marinus XMU1408 TaxID=2213228 RepID=A0A318R2A5_PROMR|nr:hypothetical protein [Prochlorococcus marinus]MBW3041044.1 hypothetical protein [Prochlorococcus marinus str. XMU1408]PYE03655.1 hypothetical protein DNJ73_00245 [Prochlorococcus marinus XMU1408]
MAKDHLRELHLFAMETALPFGMGMLNKAKTGGLKTIVNVFRSDDPISEFQVHGESSAKTVRDKIDQIIPGLGHPIVSVDVTVEETHPDCDINDQDSLVSILRRIDSQLDELSDHLSMTQKHR